MSVLTGNVLLGLGGQESIIAQVKASVSAIKVLPGKTCTFVIDLKIKIYV